MVTSIQLLMALVLFGLGIATLLGGLWTILSREYQTTLRSLAAQSALLGNRVSSDTTLTPILDSISRLVEAVSQLIRTAVGVGVFLCLVGLSMCVLAFWIITHLNPWS